MIDDDYASRTWASIPYSVRIARAEQLCREHCAKNKIRFPGWPEMSDQAKATYWKGEQSNHARMRAQWRRSNAREPETLS